MAGDILDPASRLEKLIAKQEPQFAAGFLVLVREIKESVDLEEIANLIQSGRLEEAFTQTLRRVPALGNIYLNSFMIAAKDTARFLNQNLEEIVIDFDQTNQFAVRTMQEEKLRLVREFTQGQRDATRQALVDGIQRGNNPMEQARAFRDSIGLTAKQQRSVENFRRLLEQGDSGVFSRVLRDRRFDRTIRRALLSGEGLSREQIDMMVGRYRERFIKHRSQVIARTESLRSVHQGNQVMYEQAIEAGDLDPNNLTNEWNTAKDERVRDSHAAMHNQKVPFGQPFVSGRGNAALHPGAFGVAYEDVQCRCAVGTRITNVVVPSGFTAEIIGF